ncbi:hypothetical protein [uncultured Delftia sp.]|uniref:hypothetical protein n=1 Tax=uncultured Delftia sp. TaxID=191464 RepID=UPI0025924E5B|nr:hypothetical protein [uncultured Delftia sp.]
MSEGKNVSVSFRVSARFKALLEAAAARERRSQTNMLEMLLFQYCDAQGIETPEFKAADRTQAEGPTK